LGQGPLWGKAPSPRSAGCAARSGLTPVGCAASGATRPL